MTVIDDLSIAVDNYETNSCATEIVNFSIDGGGAVLNIGETFKFQVRLTNQGQLNMRNVTLRALGSAFADVATLSSAFGSSAASGAFNLDAHQTHTTGQFRGRAKAITAGPKNIVTARVDGWDANLDHILNTHANVGTAEGKLNKDILPT